VDGGWTSEVVVTLVVGVIAAALSIVALVLQSLLWRREGPLLRLEVRPAWTTDDGVGISLRPKGATAGDRPDAVSIVAYSTGRQPVYIASLHLETMAVVKRTPTWRRPWAGERQLFLPRLENYLGANTTVGRLDAAERRDYIIDEQFVQALAQTARDAKKRDTIRAVVLLGNGKVIRSQPFATSGPVEVGIQHLEVVVVPNAASGPGSRG
jgi:hypothetical protein